MNMLLMPAGGGYFTSINKYFLIVILRVLFSDFSKLLQAMVYPYISPQLAGKETQPLYYSKILSFNIASDRACGCTHSGEEGRVNDYSFSGLPIVLASKGLTLSLCIYVLSCSIGSSKGTHIQRRRIELEKSYAAP